MAIDVVLPRLNSYNLTYVSGIAKETEASHVSVSKV